MRCLNRVEAINHPDRLKYPMKRAGERGENKWERITWDEAMTTSLSARRARCGKSTAPSPSCARRARRAASVWQLHYLLPSCLQDGERGAHRLHGLRVLPAAHHAAASLPWATSPSSTPRRASRPLHGRRVPSARGASGVGQRAFGLQRRRLHWPLAGAVRADGLQDHLHRPASDLVGRSRGILAARPSRHRRGAGHAPG